MATLESVCRQRHQTRGCTRQPTQQEQAGARAGSEDRQIEACGRTITRNVPVEEHRDAHTGKAATPRQRFRRAHTLWPNAALVYARRPLGQSREVRPSGPGAPPPASHNNNNKKSPTLARPDRMDDGTISRRPEASARRLPGACIPCAPTALRGIFSACGDLASSGESDVCRRGPSSL